MKKYLVLLVLLTFCFASSAYDFSAVAPTGQTLYYRITSDSLHTVELVVPNDLRWTGYDKPTGALIVPDSVSYNGNTYLVTSIGDFVFLDNNGLTSLTIPNSVDSIGKEACNWCDRLNSLIIGETVTIIKHSAFGNCKRLTSVTIPRSVTTIEDMAFWNCDVLGSMSVDTGNVVYDSRDNCNAIIETSTNTLVFGCKNTNIPNSVTSIGVYAFYLCTGLTSVTIPNSVTSIGSNAFSDCSGLRSVTIGNSMTSIGTSAFSGCSNLRTVFSYNPTAPTLGGWCFYLCPIWEINIPCGSMDSYSSRWSSYSSLLQETIPPFDMTLLSDNDTMGSVTLLSDICADTSIIEAIPNYGYHFTQWNDGNTDNPRASVLTQDTSFTAEFDRNSYTITGVACDTLLGQVQGGGSYLYLDTIALTATAADHYHFTRWQDDNIENPRSIVVYRDSIFTAQFAIDTQHIVVVSSDTNMGYVSGGGDIAYGQPVTVEATAYSGYHFSCWSDGSRYNPYTFTAIQDLTLSAVFVSDETLFDTITVAANNASMGRVGGSGTYDDGTVALITATPNAGCHFLHWDDGDTDAQRLVLVNATMTYTAYFAPESCHVSTATNDANAGVVSGGGLYGFGDTLSLTATPNEGYHFTQWSDGSTDSVRTLVVDENLSAAMEPMDDGAYGITFTAYFENGTQDIEKVEKSYMLTVVGDVVRISGAMGATVRVYDVEGRQLLAKKLDGEDIRLPQTGVFFVQVGDAPSERVVVVR